MVLISGIIKTYFLKRQRERARGRENRGKKQGGQNGANWAQMGDAVGFQGCPTTNTASITPLQETRALFPYITELKKKN